MVKKTLIIFIAIVLAGLPVFYLFGLKVHPKNVQTSKASESSSAPAKTQASTNSTKAGGCNLGEKKYIEPMTGKTCPSGYVKVSSTRDTRYRWCVPKKL